MSIRVEWDDAVTIGEGEDRLVFDPQSERPYSTKVFITHAHMDHARGFSFLKQTKFCTKETLDLMLTAAKGPIRNVRLLRYGERVRFDDISVTCRNSGHILGSSLYEVETPEGTVIYTGDLNVSRGFTTQPASVMPCDILVIEATFGSPSFVFPSRRALSFQMISWAKDCIQRGRLPVLRTDHVGNAQEVTSAFNLFSDIPVVSDLRVARVTRAYKALGHDLEQVSASSKEGEQLVRSRRCVLVAPKNSDLPASADLEPALASGWAVLLSRSRQAFALSDHSDFPHLFEYVKAVSPKRLYTCFGGGLNETFARLVEKRCGIKARPLTLANRE
ncbi:MAG: MBL fold metallo-hydrolase [Candidatus Bathyarchaeia archaeon]